MQTFFPSPAPFFLLRPACASCPELAVAAAARSYLRERPPSRKSHPLRPRTYRQIPARLSPGPMKFLPASLCPGPPATPSRWRRTPARKVWSPRPRRAQLSLGAGRSTRSAPLPAPPRTPIRRSASGSGLAHYLQLACFQFNPIPIRLQERVRCRCPFRSRIEGSRLRQKARICLLNAQKFLSPRCQMAGY